MDKTNNPYNELLKQYEALHKENEELRTLLREHGVEFGKKTLVEEEPRFSSCCFKMTTKSYIYG